MWCIFTFRIRLVYRDVDLEVTLKYSDLRDCWHLDAWYLCKTYKYTSVIMDWYVTRDITNALNCGYRCTCWCLRSEPVVRLSTGIWLGMVSAVLAESVGGDSFLMILSKRIFCIIVFLSLIWFSNLVSLYICIYTHTYGTFRVCP
jgi:hypothetical protein